MVSENANLDEILNKFLKIYPEFKPVLETDEQKATFYAQVEKVACLYPEFKDLSKCCQSSPFLSLTAHYFVAGGFSAEIGITSAQQGVLASSSVGDISVSYQSSPYATKGDEFTYFLATTRYGQEYLAWLARQSGLRYVN